MMPATIIEPTGYSDPNYVRRIAIHMMLVRNGRAGAISELENTLANWKGDTRRDGDTPKTFWQAVLAELVEGNGG